MLSLFFRAALATAGLALAATTVHAQDSDTLRQCHAIADNSARLRCYDRLSGRLADDAGPEAPESISQQADLTESQPFPIELAHRSEPSTERLSILETAWGKGVDTLRYPVNLYHPSYLLPISYSNNMNNAPFSPVFNPTEISEQELDAAEAKFQFSLKARLWTNGDRRWSLWGAYTQQSQWQLYNDEISRPFRETNYMPEVFASWRPDISIAGLDWKLLNFGYQHQSNGRAGSISRSWDRLFVEAGVERNNLAVMLRVWSRISESAEDDDNPDIGDFLGHGQFNLLYRWRDHSLTFMGRGNLDTGKGAVEVAWFSPPILGALRGYLQVFSGYGESLIDYNWNQTTVGIGIALNDGL